MTQTKYVTDDKEKVYYNDRASSKNCIHFQ